MDFVERLNRAVDYIEEHLCDEIDQGRIAAIMATSYAQFQATFAQLTNLSVAEYSRRRRLSLAACELRGSSERLIDLGLKYGYQSADAFTVAFKRLHGVSPSDARRGGMPLRFHARLRFSLTMKGAFTMDYSFLQKESFRVAGVRRTTPYGGGTWAIVKSDGSNEAMRALSGRFFDLGLCFGFGADGSNDYMCAIEWAGEAPPGLDSYEYPSCGWLRFEAKGKISENALGSTWQRINGEFLPQSRYREAGLPTIEKYLVWDEAVDQSLVEIWIPIKEK
ncbi:MAG: AraC family transcriptional regulator [Christensenellaceae bacterium]|nr:AraC family transcriptional regulator [Christensenellaceae bacterium]